MTKYAEISAEGNLIRVFTIDPPLSDKEIHKLPNGKASIRPVISQVPTLAAGQRLSDAPSFVITDNAVSEVYAVEAIPVIAPDAASIEARKNALPKADYEMDLLWSLVNRLLAASPKVTVTAAEQQMIDRIHQIRTTYPVDP